jgi:hypothetical protein
MRTLMRFMLVAAAIGLVGSVALADILVTKGGAEFKGRVSFNKETSTYTLETPNGGKMKFPADMVAQVKPGEVDMTPVPTPKIGPVITSTARPVPTPTGAVTSTAAPTPTESASITPTESVSVTPTAVSPAPTDSAAFFGVRQAAGKVVYVVDRSGSMTDSIDALKSALVRSIAGLKPTVQFHVIFYSSGPPVEMPPGNLVPATVTNKQKAGEFIKGVVAMGETDPSKAFERALECRPDVIFFLTDGEFEPANIALVKRLNVGGKTVVHTFCFLYKTGEDLLKKIASENGGIYTFITDADVSKLETEAVK